MKRFVVVDIFLERKEVAEEELTVANAEKLGEAEHGGDVLATKLVAGLQIEH